MKTRQVLAELGLTKHLHGHKSCITSLCFHPQLNQLVSSSHDHTVMLWNFGDKVRVFKFFGHQDVVNEVCFSPAGNLIISSSHDGTVRFWKPRLKHSSSEFVAHTRAVRSIDISYDGLSLLTASNDKSVKLWSVPRKAFLTSFTGHKNWVHSAQFLRDAKAFLTASDDKTVKLFDVQNRSCIHTFTEDGVPQKAVVHPSDLYIACGLSSGTIKIYDLKMFKLLQIYHCHKKDVNGIDFHPSGNYLFTASEDGTVKVLDLLEGRGVYTLNGIAEALTSVACSPDGRYFVFGGIDGQIFLGEADFDEINFEEDDDETDEEPKCSRSEEKREKCYMTRTLTKIRMQKDCANEVILNKGMGVGKGALSSSSSNLGSVLYMMNRMTCEPAARDERIKKLDRTVVAPVLSEQLERMTQELVKNRSALINNRKSIVQPNGARPRPAKVVQVKVVKMNVNVKKLTNVGEVEMLV